MKRKLTTAFVGLVLAFGLMTPPAGAAAPLYGHCNTTANGGDNTVTTIGSNVFAGDPDPAGDLVDWASSTSHVTEDWNHHTIVDTRDGGADGNSRTGLHIEGSGTQRCIQRLHYGYLDASTNWDDWHYRGGVKIESPETVIDTTYIGNAGDDVKFNGGSQDSRLSRSWLDQSHDDCVQSDYGQSSVIEKTLMTLCYSGLSARPSGTIDASGKTLTVKGDSIIEVEDRDACYKPASYGCPNHAGWLKWSGTGTTDLGLSLTDVTFVAASYPEIGSLGFNARKVACTNVTLDYLGSHSGSDWTNWTADKATWVTACGSQVTIKENSNASHDDASVDYFTKVSAWHSTYDGTLG